MTSVRLLVLGAGSRGEGYARYALERPQEAQVVGVAEPHDFHRGRLARAHGIPAFRCFSDWRDALSGPRFADAVVIATPDRMHVEPALAAAERGYHILLEKPMATSIRGCRQIAEAVRRHGVLFALCHVLRYTSYTRRVKELVDSGRIGELASLQRLEPIGFWHFAHSYVRGNWRRQRTSCSMLLAKCGHDLDWIRHVVGRPWTRVSSFGDLFHFRREAKPPAAGAARRCLDCAIEAECPYSARRIYLDRVHAGEAGWPISVVSDDPTPEGVTAALRSGPYGRCVYECDNDVVDHQVVNLAFESGGTASFTATAFTPMQRRHTRLFGTRGEIRGDGRWLHVHDFVTGKTERIDSEEPAAGGLSAHGGGDGALVRSFLRAVAEESPQAILSGTEESLESQLLVLAAERARREQRVVSREEIEKEP